MTDSGPMYLGFLQFADNEISNYVRVSTYVEALGLGWFNPQEVCLGVPVIHPIYETPALDNAPWVDFSRPESEDFAGFWPLEISGIGESTLSRTVNQRIGNGGVVGAARHGSREMVVRGVLLGKTQESVAAGTSWLVSVLEGRFCGHVPVIGDDCVGYDLDYFVMCPGQCGCDLPVCDEDCRRRWRRHLYGVALTSGPEVLKSWCVNGRGYASEIQFVLTAANPYRFSDEFDARAFGFSFTYEILRDDAGFATYADYKVAVPTYGQTWDYLWGLLGPGGGTTPPGPPLPDPDPPPLVDPDCPVIPAFPGVPQADIYCGDLWDGSWQRTTFRMANTQVSKWQAQLPVITLHDPTRDHNDIRIRFTPSDGSPDEDFVGEFYVTWLPEDSTIHLSGPRDTIWMNRGYGNERAEHLVIQNSRGAPLRWPVVTCGGSWLITVDTPSTDDITALEIELALVTAEP